MRPQIWASGIATVIAIANFGTTGKAQAYGISAYSKVESILTPITINGAYFNPTCQVVVAPQGTLDESFYQIAPYSCGGTYQGVDPKSGVLYTEAAIGRINSAWVNEGTTNLSVASSGGTADANIQIGENLDLILNWSDKLTVSGPPAGTPVALKFTNSVNNGDFTWSGGIVSPESYIESSYQLLQTQPSVDFACPQGQVRDVYINYSFQSMQRSINSNQSAEVCAYSGETFNLMTDAIAAVTAGGSAGASSWSANVDWSDTVYVDSLTPGVSLITASGASYGSPSSKVPAPNSGCSGTFTGVFHGNLEVLPGQNCIFAGGGVTGSVTQTGGKLTLTKAYVGGGVAISGGTFSIGPYATIDGNLNISRIPQSSVVNEVCSSNVKGKVVLQDNGAGIEFGSTSSKCSGNAVGGSLQAEYNTGAIEIVGDSVGTSLEIQNDSSLTTVQSNQVVDDLSIENNTGNTQVLKNSVTHTLLCEGDSSITGSGNAAQQKLGQCAKF